MLSFEPVAICVALLAYISIQVLKPQGSSPFGPEVGAIDGRIFTNRQFRLGQVVLGTLSLDEL